MSKIQNIYTVSDNVICPVGEGEVINNYLEGVFSRIASKVVSLGQPVDWLVVKSDDLDDVCFSSQNFFEERLEKKLKEHNPDISVVRSHSQENGGHIPNNTIKEWIGKHIEEKDISFNYFNDPNLDVCFVGYHLNMPKE
jgi:hypothetical protein